MDTVREIDALIAWHKHEATQGAKFDDPMSATSSSVRALFREQADNHLRAAAALEAAKGLYEALGYYDSANYIDGPHWNRQRVPDGERAHEARAAFEAVVKENSK